MNAKRINALIWVPFLLSGVAISVWLLVIFPTKFAWVSLIFFAVVGVTAFKLSPSTGNNEPQDKETTLPEDTEP